ncbi:MAG: Rpn family recombination-promoting nuclease/putative transposase [Fretibacterium sp.]|nr:Rpn family recombination-promoting nuclease/putative transposase [Fretibacterium sp.]
MDKNVIVFDESLLPSEQRWENLNLSNDFLFGKVMQDLELCRELIHRILPDVEIDRIRFVETQKSLQAAIDTRGVRFDLYTRGDSEVIDVEMQALNRGYLPKRTRGYHILMGIDAMNKETMKTYKDLPRAFVIFICPFDPFGRGRHIYTFRNFCCEDKDLELNDGAVTIFLNAKGTMDDVSHELRAFLDFLTGKTSDDPFIKKLEEALNEARKNSSWRREYMMLLMRDQEKIEEGRIAGLAEGRREANFETARRLRDMGMTDSDIHRATNLSFEDLRKL